MWFWKYFLKLTLIFFLKLTLIFVFLNFISSFRLFIVYFYKLPIYHFVYAIQRSLVFVVNMSFISQLYNTLFRRTSTFALTIITSAFIFERVIDEGGDYVFNRINQGVSLPSFTIFHHTVVHTHLYSRLWTCLFIHFTKRNT